MFYKLAHWGDFNNNDNFNITFSYETIYGWLQILKRDHDRNEDLRKENLFVIF